MATGEKVKYVERSPADDLGGTQAQGKEASWIEFRGGRQGLGTAKKKKKV